MDFEEITELLKENLILEKRSYKHRPGYEGNEKGSYIEKGKTYCGRTWSCKNSGVFGFNKKNLLARKCGRGCRGAFGVACCFLQQAMEREDAEPRNTRFLLCKKPPES